MNEDFADYSCFTYCPKCGARVLRPCEQMAYQCGSCGFRFYLNVAAAVVAIITDDDNRLLVAVRAKDPAKGTLDLPGGFVDPDETAEEALRREIREELNLEVIETKYLFSVPNEYPYGGVLYRTLDMVYRCKVRNFADMKPADDVGTIQWIPIRQLDPEKFGLKSIRQIVKRLIASA